MKEYIPLDIDYLLKTVKDEKQSYKSLERVLENLNPNNSSISNPEESSSKQSSDDVLETILNKRKEFLSDSINQLNSFQQQRLQLSNHLQKSIEYYAMCQTNLILEIKSWNNGDNTAIDMRRGHLEKIRHQLQQEKRNESVQCWRDILKVDREIRELLKGYMELSIKERILKP